MHINKWPHGQTFLSSPYQSFLLPHKSMLRSTKLPWADDATRWPKWKLNQTLPHFSHFCLLENHAYTRKLFPQSIQIHTHPHTHFPPHTHTHLPSFNSFPKSLLGFSIISAGLSPNTLAGKIPHTHSSCFNFCLLEVRILHFSSCSELYFVHRPFHKATFLLKLSLLPEKCLQAYSLQSFLRIEPTPSHPSKLHSNISPLQWSRLWLPRHLAARFTMFPEALSPFFLFWYHCLHTYDTVLVIYSTLGIYGPDMGM